MQYLSSLTLGALEKLMIQRSKGLLVFRSGQVTENIIFVILF